MDLIAGLGNPGARYKETRHNIGYQVIDLLSCDFGVRLTGRGFQSINIRATYEGKEIILLCPMTFMNLSGKAIKECADHYDLKTENIMIIHDDLDLPLGRIKVVRNGGAGGHKGVLSVIDYLSSKQFPRVKIGIGRPRYGETPEDYVLAPFYNDDKGIMGRMISIAASACRKFILGGVESAISFISHQNILEQKEVEN